MSSRKESLIVTTAIDAGSLSTSVGWPESRECYLTHILSESLGCTGDRLVSPSF